MTRPAVIVVLICLALSALCFSNTAWIHSKAWLAQHLILRAWEQTVATGRQHRPWPWADFWPVARLLSPGDGRQLVVLNTASGEALSFGPAYLHRSAFPSLAGDGIIAGHRDTHFRFLKEIENGDELLIQYGDGGVRQYRVTSMQVFDSRYNRLEPANGSPLRLVTCYPFDAVLPGGPQRLVVMLEKIRNGKQTDGMKSVSKPALPSEAQLQI